MNTTGIFRLASTLRQRLESRTPRKTVIVDNQPPNALLVEPRGYWYGLIWPGARWRKPTFADAILDRIVHNAYRIELDGASMRKTIAKKR